MDRRSLLKGALTAPAAGLLGAAPTSAAPAAFDVFVGEISTGRIYRFDRNKRFTTANAKWSFKPGGGHPMDHRPRVTDGDGPVLLIAAGSRDSGVASIRRRRDNELLWSARLDTYLHGIERARGTGVVVVAGRSRGPAPHGDSGATPGGKIYVYRPTDRHSNSLVLAQKFDFFQAHGVLWDPQLERMWVIGGSVLQAYRIVTTASSAKLVADPDHRVKVTRGHDVQPDHTNPGRLLFTDTNGVYVYDKATRKPARLHSRHKVKSYVHHVSGEQMWTGVAESAGSEFGTKYVHFNRTGIARPMELDRVASPIVYKARLDESGYL
ncbi:hypothetical protein [Streptomyces sp. NPDC058755]|uniref:hypothetical protein n=1 Tax=Streptomyces sp. NPDC058755 TaxID=3346624 RepID=UPI0036A80BA0